jgi:hypothetical protein
MALKSAVENAREVAFLKSIVLTKPILYIQYMHVYTRVFVLCESHT